MRTPTCTAARHKWADSRGLDVIDIGVTEVLVAVHACVHCGLRRVSRYMGDGYKLGAVLNYTEARTP